MTTDDPVRRALSELAEADASRRAPPHLERAVLDAFDRQRARGWLGRCAAIAWDYRREAAAVAVAVSVTATIYFAVLDRVVVQPPVPERPVQSMVSGRPELPAVRGHLDAQEPLVTRSPSGPHPTRRPRPHRPVQSEAVRTMPTWSESDDIVHSVHVRLPRAMLSMFGVPIIEPDAAGTVNVEMLLGHDGLARTIRIVP